MKFKIVALAGIFLIAIFVEPAKASPGEYGRLSNRPNYVVIGAFRIYKNAIRFAARAHKDLKMNAKFELNPYRKLYYVYVLSTDDQTLAINEARRIRAESEFTDAWVYFGTLGNKKAAGGEDFIDINPVTTQKINEVKKDDEIKAGDINNLTQASGDPSDKTAALSSTEEKMKSPDETPGKAFIFKVFRAVDSVTVEGGDVYAIDNEKTKKFGTYKTNVTVKLPDNNMKQVSFVCEVFGYRKVQRDVDYANPERDSLMKDESGAVIVPFELMRLQKGDMAIMYHVYFYTDAAIMRPESRYEINSLLNMMNENPKRKIRLHGHTNGNAAGRIIKMGKDSQDFFALSDTKDGHGSAKQLSEERAEVIRGYLISSGIDPSRVEVKGWGGKRGIYDTLGARAKENVRVEVEILED